MTENELSQAVIGAAIEVHKELGGPGLLEDIYEEALCCELEMRGIPHKRQVGIKVIYKGRELRKRLVLDLVVADKLIVECKAVDEYNKVYSAQVLTYLRQTKKKLGLAINFGETLLKDGIHRVVNKL